MQGQHQVMPSQPRVFAHQGFSTARFTLSHSIQHLSVLVLGDHQHVARIWLIGLDTHEARGRRKRQAGCARNFSDQHIALCHDCQQFVKLPIELYVA